ncbi:uncharacterized protein LOC135475315 [Liolophura sinensis]|uniref:uncharacterized protein LOC135475315 n=1 Tax=Liolophura sinensis TaxID=3198878 RepID=UPI0031597040
MGWLCVGIWTGISFLICGIISIIAGKSTNTLTVLFMACVNVLTLNFAFTGAVITFSSLFPDPHFYSVKEGYANGVVHNQTTGTAVGITHLVVSFIEIVTCITGVRISWKIMTSSINAEGYRRTQSYDEPYTSMDSYSMPSSSQTQRRTLENPTPPPTYDAATHSLSTSPKTVNVNRTRANRYGSLTDTQTDISDVF